MHGRGGPWSNVARLEAGAFAQAHQVGTGIHHSYCNKQRRYTVQFTNVVNILDQN